MLIPVVVWSVDVLESSVAVVPTVVDAGVVISAPVDPGVASTAVTTDVIVVKLALQWSFASVAQIPT